MHKKKYLIITGAHIVTEKSILSNAAIVVRDHIIEAIITRDEIVHYPSSHVLDFPESYHVVPGFIDMHIHGANAYDVMDASFDALSRISETLVHEGTTSYLATTMTAPVSQIENVLSHVRAYVKRQHEVEGAKVEGVHLEGPFLSPNKVGAQNAAHILNPDSRLVECWQKISGNSIKLITLAPELKNSMDLIRYLKSQHIIASLGHTDSTYAEALQAIDAGGTYVTHLFNAMSGIHQREPGVVSAALLSDSVTAELIVDGVHVHPAIVKMALKLKGIDKLVLVTDAMRAKCLCDGEYDLGGQTVIVNQGVARLKNGTLAGSTLKMFSALKNMLEYTQCGVMDAVKMASVNPAKLLGIFDKKGSIAVNKTADLVVLDDQFTIKMTVLGGRLVKSAS